MNSPQIIDSHGDVPLYWKKVMYLLVLAKTAVGGAGLAIALLGLFDVAAAVTAQQWLSYFQTEHYLDTFAGVGAGAGFFGKLIWDTFASV